MSQATRVLISRMATKQFAKLPRHIQEAVVVWASSVEEAGIAKVRKLPGYHDEPLRGNRIGQRSVRLNKAYRLFYSESFNSRIITLTVLEINHHDYR
jgi:proteic killer suppression protein